MNAQELLREVADRFESGRYTWIQRTPVDVEREHCVLTAINQVSYENDMGTDDACIQLANEISGPGVADFAPRRRIVSWNDEYGRTVGEVVAALRTAASD